MRVRLKKKLAARSSPDSKWFWDHYEWAAAEIANFCQAAGLELGGLEIADIGCGDGLLTLGLLRAARPRRLVGFDITPTDVEVLSERCRAEGIPDQLPPELEFRTSEAIRIPAADGEFDFVYSWSAFEHIAQPLEMMREIRRILRPGGQFFLQLWPFYLSGKGSHLWDWFEDDFHHLRQSGPVVVAQMHASDRHPEEWTSYMKREFEQLNRITLDELQRVVLAAGFNVGRMELLTAPVDLTPDLARYPWSDLAIGGIKLLASAPG